MYNIILSGRASLLYRPEKSIHGDSSTETRKATEDLRASRGNCVFMVSNRKTSKFVLLSPDLLDCVDNNFVVNLEEQFDDGAFSETQIFPIDDVLVALRKSFSLTYPSNPYILSLIHI